MGNFLHFKAVEFANATGAFHKATHYCSTSKHVIDYCLGVVRASMMADLCVCACVRLLRPCLLAADAVALLLVPRFRTVPPLLVKAESKIESREAASRRDTSAGAGAGGGAHGGAGAGSSANSAAAEAAAAETATMRAQVNACIGIVNMHSGAFRNAAAALCLVPPGKISDEFRDVTVDADIALYAGMCALASMTRHELQHSVLTSPLFNAEACLEPLVRRSIEDFCASRYDRCLATMGQFKVRWWLSGLAWRGWRLTALLGGIACHRIACASICTPHTKWIHCCGAFVRRRSCSTLRRTPRSAWWPWRPHSTQRSRSWRPSCSS